MKTVSLLSMNRIGFILKNLLHFACRFSLVFMLSLSRLFCKPSASTKDIAAVRLDHIGDLVCCIPVIHSLKTKDNTVSAIIDRSLEGLANTLCPEIRWIGVSTKFRDFFTVFALLRTFRFDRIVILNVLPSIKVALFLYAFPFAKRAGLGMGNAWNMMLDDTIAIKRKNNGEFRHETNIVADVLPLCGSNLKKYDVVLSTSKCIDIDKSVTFTGCTAIGIFPVAAAFDVRRMWSLESWREVCNELIKQCNAHLWFFGSKADSEYTGEIVDGLEKKDHVTDLSGTVSLADLPYWIKSMHICIGVCSGPAHIAQILNVPIIQLVGSTPVKRWVWPHAEKYAISAQLPCQPCECEEVDIYHNRCRLGQVECMNYIKPQMVFDYACKALSDRNSNQK
jgi:ADP-heptose:LPS heptosyltransferase